MLVIEMTQICANFSSTWSGYEETKSCKHLGTCA